MTNRGVPPLARRGPGLHHRHGGHRRGTSARAERTGVEQHQVVEGVGYLRSRGEDGRGAAPGSRGGGVPPLARRGRPRTAAPAPGGPGYLRSRGEDETDPAAAAERAGVPPLARRGHRPARLQQLLRRGTSARAERTPGRSSGTSSAAGYLRSRGEDSLAEVRDLDTAGVPPLVRRGHQLTWPTRRVRRGTSARAERTASCAAPTTRPSGYLRSRGEDTGSPLDTVTGDGVPPLARRGLLPVPQQDRRGRGTSARAERTTRRWRRCRWWPGYLRSRGEDAVTYTPRGMDTGVPPLAWRGLALVRAERDVRRGTSARAERTRGCGRSRTPGPGYLRSRGEDRVEPSFFVASSGVPPLARRGRIVVLLLRLRRRGTSARAERTPASTPSPPW